MLYPAELHPRRFLAYFNWRALIKPRFRHFSRASVELDFNGLRGLSGKAEGPRKFPPVFLRELSVGLRRSVGLGGESEAVALGHPIMPVGDGLGS